MSGESRISFTGNVGSDPDVKFLDSGRTVADFSVAVTPRVKKGEEWGNGSTIWFKVTAFGRIAEQCAEEITKGNKVHVDGKMFQEEYLTKAGEERTVLRVWADEVSLAMASPNKANRPAPNATEATQDEVAPF